MNLNDKKELIDLIHKYIKSDVKKLVLQRKHFIKQEVSLDDFNFILVQIAARQKTADKFKTLNENYNFLFPTLQSAEQASSEATANYKTKIISNYNTSIDLTGGLGIDSLYFAKHSQKHIYCEKNAVYCNYFLYNKDILNYKNINIINETAEEVIEYYIKNNTKFDLLYIDPSRRDKSGTRKLLLYDLLPNILELQHKWNQITNNVIIKLSPMFDIKEAIKLIANVSQVHIISINNECKELLLILNYEKAFSSKTDEIQYYAINITNTKEDILHIDNELTAKETNYSEPLKYIYEPNSSLMKLGNWNYISNKYDLNKLHPNTHLWTSDKYINDFAGKCFELENILPYSKDAIAKAKIKTASIKIRNFPYSKDEIKKKLKITEGDEKYIFATTLLDNKPVILVVNKI